MYLVWASILRSLFVASVWWKLSERMNFAGHLSPIFFSLIVHAGIVIFTAGFQMTFLLLTQSSFWVMVVISSAISAAVWYLAVHGQLLFWTFVFTSFISFMQGWSIKAKFLEFLSYLEQQSGTTPVSN